MDIYFNKWLAMMMAVMFVAMFSALAIKDYNENKLSIEAVKSGLEQCPKDPDGMNNLTIWVKDCKAYIEMRRSAK